MTKDASRIVCGACGKSYAYKPEFAGRSVKCKCGNKIRVEAPPPVEVSPADEFDLAFAGVSYDVAPEPTPAPSSARTVAARLPNIPAPLNYATPPRQDPIAKRHAIESQIKDLYVPLAMIVAGIILLFVDASILNIRNPIGVLFYVAASAIINTVLVFIAMFAAVKLLDLGLGTLGPAILKLLAISLLPSAVGAIVGHLAFGFFSWGITLGCYYALLYYLFDLEASEVRIATAIIWGLRFVSNILIIAFAASVLGVAGKGIRPSPTPRPYAVPSARPRGLGSRHGSISAGNGYTDEQAAETINTGNAFEAREWCAPDQERHAGGSGVPRSTMLVVAKSFYNAGAKKVWAANPVRENGLDLCSEFIVEMPEDNATRKKVLEVKAALEKQVQPDLDNGHHFLLIELLTYREY